MTTTPLGRNEIAGLIAEWPANAVGALVSFARLDAGTINSNYRVQTDRGRFFLRLNEGKSDPDVDYEVGLLKQLVDSGLSTPLPVVANTGSRWVAYRSTAASEEPTTVSKQAMLFPWVEGDHLAADDVDEAAIRQLGRALASMHEATSRLPKAWIRENAYSTKAIANRLEAIGKREIAHGPTEITDIVPLLSSEIDWLKTQASTRAESPTLVIHGDLFRDNVMFNSGKLVALIDFEQAGGGTAGYDIAVCINAWCFVSGRFQPNLIAALVSAYREARDQSSIAPTALWIEARAAALRFAVTRITDVFFTGLERPDKSYKRYLERLQELQTNGQALFASLP